METVIFTSEKRVEAIRHCGACGLQAAGTRQDSDLFIEAIKIQRGLDLLEQTGVDTSHLLDECKNAMTAKASPDFDPWKIAEACRRCVGPVEIISKHTGDPASLVFEVPKRADAIIYSGVRRN